MHLHYLLEKRNRHCQASEGIECAESKVDGEVLLGVRLPAGRASSIRLLGASDYPHVQTGLDDIGLTATVLGRRWFAAVTASVLVSFVAGADRVTRKQKVTSRAWTRLLLPSMLDLPDPFARADLLIEVDRPVADVFLGSSRRVPRTALYRLARGTGVEIGPGPRPQIHNGPDVQVTYVEEMPAERWCELYRSEVSREAWDQAGYRIGKAHDLPVADGSLDFVFSSHVLEHLHNPLGHFDHWRRKLRPGGLVLAVVPAVDGTKDFALPPTSLAELIAEHGTGSFDVPLPAYERWVRHTQSQKDPIAAARQYHADRFSIHVHAYDYVTINNLLRRCVEAHGFTGYRILYKKNSKDFAFALRA